MLPNMVPGSACHWIVRVGLKRTMMPDLKPKLHRHMIIMLIIFDHFCKTRQTTLSAFVASMMRYLRLKWKYNQVLINHHTPSLALIICLLLEFQLINWLFVQSNLETVLIAFALQINQQKDNTIQKIFSHVGRVLFTPLLSSIVAFLSWHPISIECFSLKIALIFCRDMKSFASLKDWQ